MANFRGEKLSELFRHAAAQFLHNEASPASLLTVTRAIVSDDGKYATIFFTVFPPELEKTALEFAKRKRPEFKEFVKAHARIRAVPFFDFAIDEGEKNRQKIDQLSSEDNAKNKKAGDKGVGGEQ
jgi:ribosome-binding factor A